MHITPLGDAALVVHVCGGFEKDAERCLTAVTAARARLLAARLPGVIEIAPAFTTVAVFFDPLRTSELDAGILTALRKRSAKRRAKARTIRVPVCYDDEFAIDIGDVAARAASPHVQ
jgi:inhibitor of KinA